MPKLATMQRSQGLEANRQFDANQADKKESRAASHMARDDQTRISTKPTTTLSVEHLPLMTMRKPSRIAVTAHSSTFRKPDPSTRHLDRFKTIISHGTATGSRSASEALYASTGVSH